MISKKYRFHGHNSLNYVYRSGKSVRGPLFLVKYSMNPKRKQWRAAVVVSKKVHKSAVVRNRIRRRLYETIRKTMPANAAAYDIVITVYSDTVATAASEDIFAMVNDQFTQAGIVNTKVVKTT